MTVALLAPWPRELGLAEVTVGAVVTLNAPVDVALVVSGLVTVTLREPVDALEVIVTLAVTDVELTKLVELTVMPVPEKDTASPDPLRKFFPLTVIV